jgi:hypothetical protein
LRQATFGHPHASQAVAIKVGSSKKAANVSPAAQFKRRRLFIRSHLDVLLLSADAATNRSFFMGIFLYTQP